MTKNTILLILAIGMMSGGVYTNAFATNAHIEEATAKQTEFVLTKDKVNSAAWIRRHAIFGKLKIPKKYTVIDSSAFEGNNKLISITIPNSVKEIRENAFKDFNNEASFHVDSKEISDMLHNEHGIDENRIFINGRSVERINNKWKYPKNGNVIIPKNVTQIEKCMFYDRKDIKSITIPDNVKSIDYSAFKGCTGLRSITIPNKVESIGDYAFKGCTGLIEIAIQDGVQRIGNCAFFQCHGLTSITIPNSVTYIGKDAFIDCNKLENVTLSNSVKSITEGAFFACEKLNTITIPSNVTSIEDSAFWGCIGLKSVQIPNSVESIGPNAFGFCNGAKFYVTSEAMANKLHNEHGIENGRIYVDGNVVDPNGAWRWPDDGNIVIPETETKIDAYMFFNRKDVNSITIPDSVTDIGAGAFLDCEKLKRIYIYNDKVKKLVVNNKDDNGKKYIKSNIIKVIKKPQK